VILLYLVGVNEIALLFGAGLLMMVIQGGRRLRPKQMVKLLMPGLPLPVKIAGLSAAVSATVVPTDSLCLMVGLLPV